MPAARDVQGARIVQLRCAPTTGSGGVGQGRQGIQAGDGAGGFSNRGGHGPHLFAQLAEQFVFALASPSTQLEDAAFPLLEFGGDESLFVGQRLPADPMIRHRAGLGFADGQEVAEGAVVLQTQVVVAAAFALQPFLFSQPGVLIVQLVAQAIEQRVHPVVDEAAFTEGERRGVHQGMADLARQIAEGRVGDQQRVQFQGPVLQAVVESC